MAVGPGQSAVKAVIYEQQRISHNDSVVGTQEYGNCDHSIPKRKVFDLN